jgi:hypothetical protein
MGRFAVMRKYIMFVVFFSGVGCDMYGVEYYYQLQRETVIGQTIPAHWQRVVDITI